MIYDELVAALVEGRFNAAKYDTRGKRWVNSAVSSIWGSADWKFRVMPPTALTLSAGDSTPAMHADFDDDIRIYDDNGNQVTRLMPTEFDDAYTADTSTGRPRKYKVVNGQYYFWPTPDTDYTFWDSYYRALSHFNSAGAYVLGPMTLGTDAPCWSVNHHEIIVVRAIMFGFEYENDPVSSQAFQGEYNDLFGKMLSALAEDLPSQPSRDPL